MFLGKFGKRPMQLFGLWGTIFFLIGLSSSGYLIAAKFMDADFGLTNKPAFFIALTTMIIGMQLFLAGFIAELVARNAPERNHYLISNKLGIKD
jgi:TRAP-type C4-dicarboxylate transport system permease small subunit